jgi:hypothetical protein
MGNWSGDLKKGFFIGAGAMLAIVVVGKLAKVI